MERYRSRCRRCGGTLAKEGDEIRCTSCGWTYFSNHERSRYYNLNRLNILNDLKTHGRKFIIQKYQIPKGTITGLLKKWALQQDQELLPTPHFTGYDRHFTSIPSMPPLPPLPPFQDAWPPEVQLLWLSIWYHFAKGRSDNETG